MARALVLPARIGYTTATRPREYSRVDPSDAPQNPALSDEGLVDTPPVVDRRKERIRTIVVWGATVLLLGYIASTTDLKRFADTVVFASPLLVLGLTGLEVLASWLYDTFALTVAFRRLLAPVRYREIFPIKGASYLLNVVNYNAGVLAIAYFLRDRKGVPFFQSFGALLLVTVVDMVAMASLLGLGLLVGTDTVHPDVLLAARLIVPAAFLGLVGTIVFWRVEPRLTFLHGLTRRGIFSAFRRARVSDYAVLWVVRFGLVLVYWLYQFALLRLFQIRIPVAALFLYYPLLIFVGTLPISVAGFGSTQLVARFLFGPFALARAGGLLLPAAGMLGAALLLPADLGGALDVAHGAALAAATASEAVVDACSTSTLTGFLVWRVVFGLISLPRVRGAQARPEGVHP